MTRNDEEVVTVPEETYCESHKPVYNWQIADVVAWAKQVPCSKYVIACLENEAIDGEVLLALNESDVLDFRCRLNYKLTYGELKKLWLAVRSLQTQRDYCNHRNSEAAEGYHSYTETLPLQKSFDAAQTHRIDCAGVGCTRCSSLPGNASNGNEDVYAAYRIGDCFNNSTPASVDGRATNIPPEFFKTAISLGYSFLVTWITSFVMVIVHERVPDMKRYPPLPDIFLDNVPHIPWAFQMCEITGTLLFTIWTMVCLFHKYRMVLLRRFFALAGTVFLLRCVTMLITSLSVPGTHLQCNQNDYAIDDTDLTITEALELRISRAYVIWSGLGMSIQGVRTCGDYMFSGHTVALTLLNFFITEYTPRNLYFLHTLSWLLNMFGIFFILAAHEHYSIDVFVAFYITSRLFLYYHTLANNQALMSRDSNRTRIWFPMFSYFESSVDGIIPNEYETMGTLFHNLWHVVLLAKQFLINNLKRVWLSTTPINLDLSKHKGKQSDLSGAMFANLLKASVGAQEEQEHSKSKQAQTTVTTDTRDAGEIEYSVTKSASQIKKET